MRPLASKLAEETDLSKYQAAYTKENSRVTTPVHEAVDDIDPSTLIDDEAVFKALTGIKWATSDFQPMDEEE